jgi:hypothetical protein
MLVYMQTPYVKLVFIFTFCNIIEWLNMYKCIKYKRKWFLIIKNTILSHKRKKMYIDEYYTSCSASITFFLFSKR